MFAWDDEWCLLIFKEKIIIITEAIDKASGDIFVVLSIYDFNVAPE
jgi:hypothetical protein